MATVGGVLAELQVVWTKFGKQRGQENKIVKKKLHPQSTKPVTTAKPRATNLPTIQGSSPAPLSTLSTKKMRTPRTRTASP
jgi:hypothetical protein